LQDSPIFLSYVNSAIAYVNATVLFGNGVSDLQTGVLGEMDEFTSNAGPDAGVIAGYKAIYSTTANNILTSPLGLIELLLANNVNGSVRITAALQHPFSNGQIYINSSNPMDYPVIDPNYLAHPAGTFSCLLPTLVPPFGTDIYLLDVQILREGLKLARRLGETDPLKSSVSVESWPGPDVQSDQEWEDWLRGQVYTEFHPSSTCAMLPRDQGGVVDASLHVYGLSNVRVADASVPPISFSAHLMSSTYGLAEQASTIIRAFYNSASRKESGPTSGKGSDSSSSSSSSPSSTSTSTSTSASSGLNGSNGGLSLHPWTFFIAVATFIASNSCFKPWAFLDQR
jgi:choline dehydrogenase